jgi:NADH:ubiquinone oxidoreductase subunit 4 (subunit M)
MNAMIQIDIKRIIAYASIGHMNVGILGLFSLDLDSICGSYVLMIGHGFVSGGLFFCIGMIYNRLHNKNINYMNGLMHLVPILCLIFFILILSNNALPGTVNFIGELIILNIGFKKNVFFFFISFGFGIFVTSIYGFLLCNKVLYGMPLRNIFFRYLKDLNLLELAVFLPILL